MNYYANKSIKLLSSSIILHDYMQKKSNRFFKSLNPWEIIIIPFIFLLLIKNALFAQLIKSMEVVATISLKKLCKCHLKFLLFCNKIWKIFSPIDYLK